MKNKNLILTLVGAGAIVYLLYKLKKQNSETVTINNSTGTGTGTTGTTTGIGTTGTGTTGTGTTGTGTENEFVVVSPNDPYILRLKKKFNLVIREKNFGLAKNIIQGVSQVLKKNSSAIFLEDDLIVSKNFLKFMNLNLIYYKNQKKVWHISGWNYNVNFNIEEDAYFTRGMNCWGWGTWRDRWKYFEKKPNVIIKSWNKDKIFRFNFDNSINFFSQIVRNQNKDINTWAIFWYAVIFIKNGLCLNPVKSLVKNTGIGNSATHTRSIEKIFNSKLNISNIKKYKLPKKIDENKFVYNLIVANFFKMKKLNLLNKFLIKAKNLTRC